MPAEVTAPECSGYMQTLTTATTGQHVAKQPLRDTWGAAPLHSEATGAGACRPQSSVAAKGELARISPDIAADRQEDKPSAKKLS